MSVSSIYVGRVSHARFAPKPHAFTLALYMLYVDLDELDTLPRSWLFGVDARRPLSFRRSDYLSKDAVRAEVERAVGVSTTGPIRLLTQVRSFGYVFNPVTFYYCFDESDQLRAVVAEITNTPWGERHRYVLAADRHGAKDRFQKRFHVSPFFPMEQDYEWSFTSPGDTVSVQMNNHQSGRSVFSAHLSLERRPFSTRELMRIAARLPLMSWKVHAAIYVHAFALWWKGAPFHSHPALAEKRAVEEHS